MRYSKIALVAAMMCSAPVFAMDLKATFEIGLEGYQETYTETVDGQKFMQEKADMLGVTSALTFFFDQANSLKLSGRYAEGNSDYTGAYQGGTYGDLTSDGQDRNATDIRVAYQYAGKLGSVSVMPSVGLGYRKLVDKMESMPVGYRRKNTLTYATVGIESVHSMGGGWKFSPKLAYNHLLKGTQRSYIGDTLTNKQKDGYGVEVSADFKKKLGDSAALKISPFFRYWSIEDSNVSSATVSNGWYSTTFSGMEPKNKTREIGLNVSVLFY